jgi:hypothetical protein
VCYGLENDLGREQLGFHCLGAMGTDLTPAQAAQVAGPHVDGPACWECREPDGHQVADTPWEWGGELRQKELGACVGVDLCGGPLPLPSPIHLALRLSLLCPLRLQN